MKIARPLILALALTGTALLTGCSLLTATEAAPTGAPAAASPTPATPTTTAPAPARLTAVRHPQLGAIVTDGTGFTLYRFDKDTAKPPTSNCVADCAVTWPPALAGDGEVAVEGIDRSLVGTITRPDGSRQITIAGWPAYQYAGDTQAGDVTGQGVGGVWFALTPEGRKAGAPAGPATTGPATTTPKAAANPTTTGAAAYAY
jgi:predicted lipoprotein with Yx(FWY)xxD motif